MPARNRNRRIARNRNHRILWFRFRATYVLHPSVRLNPCNPAKPERRTWLRVRPGCEPELYLAERTNEQWQDWSSEARQTRCRLQESDLAASRSCTWQNERTSNGKDSLNLTESQNSVISNCLDNVVNVDRYDIPVAIHLLLLLPPRSVRKQFLWKSGNKSVQGLETRFLCRWEIAEFCDSVCQWLKFKLYGQSVAKWKQN